MEWSCAKQGGLYMFSWLYTPLKIHELYTRHAVVKNVQLFSWLMNIQKKLSFKLNCLCRLLNYQEQMDWSGRQLSLCSVVCALRWRSMNRWTGWIIFLLFYHRCKYIHQQVNDPRESGSWCCLCSQNEDQWTDEHSRKQLGSSSIVRADCWMFRNKWAWRVDRKVRSSLIV